MSSVSYAEGPPRIQAGNPIKGTQRGRIALKARAMGLPTPSNIGNAQALPVQLSRENRATTATITIGADSYAVDFGGRTVIPTGGLAAFVLDAAIVSAKVGRSGSIVFVEPSIDPSGVSYPQTAVDAEAYKTR